MKQRKLRTNRRQFLKTTAAVSGGIVAGSAVTASAKSYDRIAGAGDGLRGAVIGVNGRGKNHYSGLADYIVALCDCDRRVMAKRAKQFTEKVDKQGNKSKAKDLDKVQDYRKLLERKDLDFVSIATPNHTHALIAIAAIQAGKDVYCEKPVSHNVWEGRQIVNAARKHGRIVQCGTQSRSSPGLQNALAFATSGKLGKALYAVGTCYKPRKSIGKLDGALKIPSYIDYNLWCGPAEQKEIFRPQLHYDWHWDFNTGNGDMGNQGIHQMDIARWFLGHQTISPRVLSIGGRLGYEDAADTPNTQAVIHDYAEAPIIFETRGLPSKKEFQDGRWGRKMDNYLGSQIGVVVFYEKGRIVIPTYNKATIFDNDGQKIAGWNQGGNHYKNFIEAVSKKDRSILNADILEGHLSSALCHTGGLSHQLGKDAKPEEVLEAGGNDKKFTDSISRMLDHIKANEVDLNIQSLVLGQELRFNAKEESAIDNEKSAAGLRRNDRKEFAIPDLG